MKSDHTQVCRRFGIAAAIGISAALTYAPATVAAENPAGAKLLAELVQKANQEGKLHATVQSTWSHAMLPALIEGFKKRFNLTIDMTLTPAAAARQFPIEIAATRAGAPPTYDAMQGDDAETIQLKGAGGIQPIANWKELLAAINLPVGSGKVVHAEISHSLFEGHAFLYMANVKQIAYNPRLIKPEELPKTHEELADPRFKGKFAQPPWTSHWEMAPQVFDPQARDKWIDVVLAAGKNGVVLTESEAVQRVILGQYAFGLAQDAYIRQILAKDSQAPIASQFFADYNERNLVYYSVRTRARAPAAAALFALWMTTPEAQAIWQPSNMSFQPYGTSMIDVAARETMAKSKTPIIGFLDNDKTLALLTWQQSPDGAKYLSAMARAIQGR
jgi:iron(III) transport system substrate-binding protein